MKNNSRNLYIENMKNKRNKGKISSLAWDEIHQHWPNSVPID